MEQGAEGLFPHDLARQVLDADLRWRNPQEYRPIAGRWYGAQPAAFLAFRDQDGDLIGFMAALGLHDADPADIAADPAAVSATGYARRFGPLRTGEELVYHRFYVGRDDYQRVSAATNLLAMCSVRDWLTRPRLAWSFVTQADPEYWRPLFTHLNFRFTPEAAFEVGGRRYGVYSHDWRAGPRPGATALQALLREAAEPLRGNPRGQKFYRALHRTYFEPAATQELAAERLGLPFSTYRAHLRAGIAGVTGWLWRRELSGADQAEI